MKISVEIEKIENGFTIEDSYFGNVFYFKTFKETVEKAKKILKDFEEEGLR